MIVFDLPPVDIVAQLVCVALALTFAGMFVVDMFRD